MDNTEALEEQVRVQEHLRAEHERTDVPLHLSVIVHDLIHAVEREGGARGLLDG